MNTKETLKRLHKKFPMMGLDELFEILDCYVEYSPYTITYGGNANTVTTFSSDKLKSSY